MALSPVDTTMIIPRPGSERGHANHGWLDSFHSFSFADYVDPEHTHFGPLRVINEDRVAPGSGFGTHSHRDMEIISYVLEGELAHRDSMGHVMSIRPGEVQRMSAGTGVTHSEFNHADRKTTHFLQIWVIPERGGIEPSYEQKNFPEAEKRGRLRLLVSPDGAQGSLHMHQDVRLYGGLFDAAEQARLELKPGRLGYVHVAAGRARVNGHMLQAGDALKLVNEPAVEIEQGDKADVLVFDLPR